MNINHLNNKVMIALNFSIQDNSDSVLFIVPTVATEKVTENKRAYYFAFWRKFIRVEIEKSISNN